MQATIVHPSVINDVKPPMKEQRGGINMYTRSAFVAGSVALGFALLLPVVARSQAPSNCTEQLYYTDVNDHVESVVMQVFGGVLHASALDISSQSGAPGPDGTSQMVAFEAGSTPQIYYITNGDVHEIYESGTTWYTNDVTASVGSPRAAQPVNNVMPLTGFTANGVDQVSYLGDDLHVHTLWWDTSGWHATDDTASSGAPSAVAGSALTSYADSYGNIHVFYLSADQHIQEVWWGNGVMNHVDLTTLAGVSPAKSGSPLASFFISSTSQHLFYLDANNDVNELYWGTGYTVNWVNDSASAGAGGVDGTQISAFAASGAEHVFFNDVSNIAELLWNQGPTWSFQFAGGAGGSVMDLATPLPSYQDCDGTIHVLYRANGHIMERWWNGQWNVSDDTNTAQAPTAFSNTGIAGYSF